MFTVAPFSRKSIVMGPCPCMTFFTDYCIWNFLLLESVFPLFILPFWLGLIVANTFLSKICFLVHIMHSSVNFTWFTLVNQQKFDDRLSLNWEHSIWFAAILNSLKRNIFARSNKYCYKPIPNNSEFTFMEKYSGKEKFAIFKKFPLIHWMTLVRIIDPSSVKKFPLFTE